MKKRFGLYFAAWAVLLALFNVITFVCAEWIGDGFTEAFWVGYIFITITFIGQLLCAFVALKEDNANKLFYRISLITSSYAGLIFTFIVGGLCMIITDLPYWIGIVACSIVLAANILSVLKAVAVAGIVENVDAKVKKQTFFIKSLTVDAEGLVARAKDETILANCKKVYEAVRYSDPMSSDILSGIESQITIRFATLANAVAKNDADTVTAAAEEVLLLINDRNNKCRLLK